MKVVVSAPYLQPVIDRFRHKFEEQGIELVVPKVNERLSEEELLLCLVGADGIICGDDRISARVLEVVPTLKVISKWGTGIDSIDREAAAARGIPVLNVPNAFSEPVADTVLSFILCFARGTIELDRQMRQGIWEKKLFMALNECTLGIIGLGDVGTAVKRRAEVFGMRVVATDIIEKPYDCMVPLETLLSESDFVSVNCDLNSTSEHLINADTLSQMKPSAYLINAARGPIVDEQSLIVALQEGVIAGAGLDVFEEEPLPHDSPLCSMENVILSPHNSNSSKLAWERVHEQSIEGVLRELKKHIA